MGGPTAIPRWAWAGLVIVALAVFSATGKAFTLSSPERALMSAGALGLGLAAARRGLRPMFVAVLSWGSTLVASACAFGAPIRGDGPLAAPLVLGPWTIYALAALVAAGAWRGYEKSRRFGGVLLAVFALNWSVLAFNVRFYDDWKIENWLTVPFVALLYATHRWFRLSDVSYGLIFVYMTLHIVGSHYTYAEVPLGFWLQQAAALSRNHYDRIVHFSFGLLLAYPLREMVIRISDARGFWGLWFPVEFVLAFSCLYEVIEWGIAVVFGGDLGVAYLGTQGDVWDAQKDMALAGLGSVITMTVVLAVRLVYDGRRFWRELGESLQVKKRGVLGEQALERLGQ
jgi:putative membrane protein